jgi:hypothetical protein
VKRADSDVACSSSEDLKDMGMDGGHVRRKV